MQGLNLTALAASTAMGVCPDRGMLSIHNRIAALAARAVKLVNPACL